MFHHSTHNGAVLILCPSPPISDNIRHTRSEVRALGASIFLAVEINMQISTTKHCGVPVDVWAGCSVARAQAGVWQVAWHRAGTYRGREPTCKWLKEWLFNLRKDLFRKSFFKGLWFVINPSCIHSYIRLTSVLGKCAKVCAKCQGHGCYCCDGICCRAWKTDNQQVIKIMEALGQ